MVTDVDMVFNEGGLSNKLFRLSHWLEALINHIENPPEEFLQRCSIIPTEGKRIYFPIVFRSGSGIYLTDYPTNSRRESLDEVRFGPSERQKRWSSCRAISEKIEGSRKEFMAQKL